MELTFNQVEMVFTQRFEVPQARAVAFRGRLQHLQRVEIPEGSRTGRGIKAVYGWKQLVQLMIALELLDLGVQPDVTARAVRKSSDTLLHSIYLTLLEFDTPAAVTKALKRARCPFAQTHIAVASAGALTFDRDGDPQPYVVTFKGPEFLKRLTDDPAFEPAGTYIDLGSRVMLLGQLVGRTAGLEPEEVASSLTAWFSEWANANTAS
ncbi:MAG TPA: hypothetical protein VF680_01710 [Allosphingosinicella sp.]